MEGTGFGWSCCISITTGGSEGEDENEFPWNADHRIPNDLGIIIGESADQNASLNASRMAAVPELNAEISGSATYFNTDNMIGKNWGNNDSNAPFTQQFVHHFHGRAENYLESGWLMGT